MNSQPDTDVRVGDYVQVSHWEDFGPYDPYDFGYVVGILHCAKEPHIRYVVKDKPDEGIGYEPHFWWYVRHATKAEEAAWKKEHNE